MNDYYALKQAQNTMAINNSTKIAKQKQLKKNMIPQNIRISPQAYVAQSYDQEDNEDINR